MCSGRSSRLSISLRRSCESFPPEYRGIGIRVEDDVLMTEDGPEWISAGIPKQIDEVEEWMASMAAEGAKV